MLQGERVSLRSKKERNLTWTLILLLLSGVFCKEWDVQYQPSVCAAEGSSVVIHCTFDYPQKLTVQSVKWGHERNNIYAGPFNFDSQSKNNLLRFQYIGDKHHNCSFKIHQVERNDSGKHTFRFATISKDNMVEEWTGAAGSTLKVGDLKVQVTKPNGSETVKEGDSVNLTCINSCDSGGFQSVFTWFMNGEPINEGAVLYLSSISSTNSGNYTCSLKMHTNATSGVQNIHVEYGPKNTSVHARPSSEVDAGSNITLICSSNAVPPVERYTWFKIGDGDVGKGPKLNFRGIDPRDGGQYICSVTNKHGRQNSSAVTINVKAYWPTFNTTVLIVATVAALLIVTMIIVIRRCKNTKTPEVTPETDCVEDIQNTIYINWSQLVSHSRDQNQCDGVSDEVTYATVDFNAIRKSNMQQQMDCRYDEECVIYSTVCRD